MMLSRPEITKYKSNLKTIISDFETLNFSKLPDTDLIVAMFALPFVSEKKFNTFWQNLINKLKTHGYFIGNLFDPKFNVFKEKDRKNMTFHTKSEVLELFKNFNIILFKEVKIPSESSKLDYYYEISAQKK